MIGKYLKPMLSSYGIAELPKKQQEGNFFSTDGHCEKYYIFSHRGWGIDKRRKQIGMFFWQPYFHWKNYPKIYPDLSHRLNFGSLLINLPFKFCPYQKHAYLYLHESMQVFWAELVNTCLWKASEAHLGVAPVIYLLLAALNLSIKITSLHDRQ